MHSWSVIIGIFSNRDAPSLYTPTDFLIKHILYIVCDSFDALCQINFT